jgi:signal peptidase I
MEDRDESGIAVARPSRKRAVVASILSFLVPGVGQAFNGDLTKASFWGPTIPLLIFVASPLRINATFAGLNILRVIQLLISILSAREAYRSALKQVETSGTSWLRRLGVAALAGIILGAMDFAAISTATIRFYTIPVDTMAPTIANGERVAADFHFYAQRLPQKDDVVVMKSYLDSLMVKRIAAVGGDVIEGKGGRVFVNGEPFDDRFSVDLREMGSTLQKISEFGPETIPQGKFFVLGDNRGHSWDSRSPDFGLVNRTDIKGKVLYVYWSNDIRQIGRSVK